MGIVIIAEKGRAYPKVLCDECGQTIDDAKLANYEWIAGKEPAPVVFLHKVCVRAFEYKTGERIFYAWEDLDLLPLYLAANLGIPLNMGKERTDGLDPEYTITVKPAGYEL